MPLISKQKEAQLHFSNLYDLLQNSVEIMKDQLKEHRSNYEIACQKHITSGFKHESLWLVADRNYQIKFKEFETHCILLEILNECRDETGDFIHLNEIKLCLESLLHSFIEQEAYEVCAIIKKWQEKSFLHL